MTSISVPADIAAALARIGLVTAGAAPTGRRLEGGVSSDIWRVDLPSGPICVKRALEKLRVAADWRVPVSRNLYEARWMQRANEAVPGSAPALLGQDKVGGVLAMAYLAPAAHPLWKSELRSGRVDPGFAAEIGATLARIHATTAANPAVASEFPTDDLFYAIRLEPYLVHTAMIWPDLAGALLDLVAVAQANKRALVHGDVSPKNILVGPRGPVFLDAECAWWGDPAFDLAFCLNHLLLKCLWIPSAREALLTSFARLTDAYLTGAIWEPRGNVEGRAARLLPGLFLARVDGKSPVEYITDGMQKDRVRRVAAALLRAPVDRLADVGAAWREELRR
jgi:aminoglycoside phosphotransferase (APT) family kinase protein